LRGGKQGKPFIKKPGRPIQVTSHLPTRTVEWGKIIFRNIMLNSLGYYRAKAGGEKKDREAFIMEWAEKK